MRRRAFLALGSNMGDRVFELRRAVEALPDVSKISPVYETEAIGGPEGQRPHLNAVVELRTELSARALLELAQQCELVAERKRTVPNGPRSLDVDVIIIEGEVVDDPDLVVPHPRMASRRFVLQPLADIAADVLPDNWRSGASGEVELLGELDDL